jgi:hypothetical protein
MSLLNTLRDRIGLDRSSGDAVSQRAARAAQRTGRRVRDVDTERARAATQRASRSVAVDPPGRVRDQGGRRTTREQDIAEKAESVASMRGPVEATLEPADTMGVDRLASADQRPDAEVAAEPREPAPDDLARGIGAAPPARGEEAPAERDGGIFDFSPSEPDDYENGGWF